MSEGLESLRLALRRVDHLALSDDWPGLLSGEADGSFLASPGHPQASTRPQFYNYLPLPEGYDNRDTAWVATEAGDVGSHPFDGHTLIEQAVIISGRVRRHSKAEEVCAVAARKMMLIRTEMILHLVAILKGLER